MITKRTHQLGPGGFCICPKCGEKTPHARGTRCQENRCPRCGAKMLREGSHHHRLFEEHRSKDPEAPPG